MSSKKQKLEEKQLERRIKANNRKAAIRCKFCCSTLVEIKKKEEPVVLTEYEIRQKLNKESKKKILLDEISSQGKFIKPAVEKFILNLITGALYKPFIKARRRGYKIMQSEYVAARMYQHEVSLVGAQARKLKNFEKVLEKSLDSTSEIRQDGSIVFNQKG